MFVWKEVDKEESMELLFWDSCYFRTDVSFATRTDLYLTVCVFCGAVNAILFLFSTGKNKDGILFRTVYKFLFNNLSKNEKQFSNLCIDHADWNIVIFC